MGAAVCMLNPLTTPSVVQRSHTSLAAARSLCAHITCVTQSTLACLPGLMQLLVGESGAPSGNYAFSYWLAGARPGILGAQTVGDPNAPAAGVMLPPASGRRQPRRGALYVCRNHATMCMRSWPSG